MEEPLINTSIQGENDPIIVTSKKEKKKKKDKNRENYGTYNEESPLLTSGFVSESDAPRDSKSDNEDDVQAVMQFAKSKYDMKNHMANERTFFKYAFTGLHIGGIGTLVLSFFAQDDVYKLYLVLLIWLVAFGFMFYGLYSYYKRRHLMQTGHFKDSQLLNPHTPIIITIIFVCVIILVITYALMTNQVPLLTDTHKTSDNKSSAPAIVNDKTTKSAPNNDEVHKELAKKLRVALERVDERRKKINTKTSAQDNSHVMYKEENDWKNIPSDLETSSSEQLAEDVVTKLLQLVEQQ